MRDEHVEFLETVRIQQQFDPLARRQLALGVLRVDPALAAAQARGLPALVQLLQDVLHRDLLPSRGPGGCDPPGGAIVP